MMTELKRLRCACGWEVTGTVDEVVPAVIDHGARLHNMQATRDEVLLRLEPATNPVDEYIAAQSTAAQPRLRELRAIFRDVLPEATETISYDIPTYRFPAGRVYFGAAKKHCAVYGAAAHLMPDELRGYAQPKGTVRFPLDTPIPETLVRKLLEVTVADRQAAQKG